MLASLCAVSSTAGLQACSSSDPALLPGERGRVSWVSDGDLIGLETGLRVRLVNIEAPSPFGDAMPYAEEAKTLIERVAMGRMSKLFYDGLTRDRYDRALAHVFISPEVGKDIWLNAMMITQGAAWVRTWPENLAKATALLQLEQEARAAKLGLWADDTYRVRKFDDLENLPRFAIVEGTIASITPTTGYGRVLLRANGLHIEAPPIAQAIQPPAHIVSGQTVRVRGRSRTDEQSNDQSLDFTHWQQIEAV